MKNETDMPKRKESSRVRPSHPMDMRLKWVTGTERTRPSTSGKMRRAT